MDLKSEIRDRMAARAPFGVWTPADFLDLGSRDAVDQALSRMTAAEELEALSGKKRHARLNAIKAAGQAYVSGSVRTRMVAQLRETLQTAGLLPTAARIELDPDDHDQQTLLIWYPQVTSAPDGYIRLAVKIESGAKSALDPNHPTVIRPYVG